MIKLVFILCISLFAHANSLILHSNTSFYDLLPVSSIYIDKTNTLTIVDVMEKDSEFKENKEKSLTYGYAPDFNVWIKFTINNTTSETVNKILEYGNPLTTDIEFFSPQDELMKKEGLFHIDKNRKTVNPIFQLQLKSGESKTYYIKATSKNTTLIVKLNLWDQTTFYDKEIKHQLILALFFGAMLVMAIYNLFIYIFSKDISYFYYVFYLVGIIVHQLLYVGFASIYLLNQMWMIYITEIASIIVLMPTLALALFTKSFLKTKQYPRLNNILNIFLYIVVTASLVVTITDVFDKYRSLFPALFLVFLMFVSFYAAYQKDRQAYFIVFTWMVFLAAGMFMYLSSAGIFSVFNYVSYYVEISLITEAIVFSIALAYRIRQLQNDKIKANNKLIEQQKNEKKRLEEKVSEKTKDLEIAFKDKEVLLKELNHRVKNNMQMIVSLIRLQMDEIEDDKVTDMLLTIQNRINAMSQLHELLYYQEHVGDVKAYDYFGALIEEIKESYDDSVKIDFNISTNLKIEQAVYCGLILNELITNAFKHAFVSVDNGNIQIGLSKEDDIYTLTVKDNGIGFPKTKSSHSLGLVLVKSLVQKLKASMQIDSEYGVEIEIKWK